VRVALLRRPAARRTAWTVVEQGLSSLTNFAVTIAVARSVDDVAFGAFATAYLIYLLAAIVMRSLVTGPLAVRASVDTADHLPAAAAAGASVVCGAALGVVIVVAGLAVGGGFGRTLAVFGAFLAPLLLQDAWRFVFITLARPLAAVANELVWIAGQAVFLGLALTVVEPTPVNLTAAWAAGASLAALAGIAQAGFLPAVRHGWAFVRQHRDLGVPFAGASVAQFGATQATTLLLGAVVGVAGVGALRGAQTLFGPLAVVFVGLNLAAVPEGSRLAARSPHRLPRALEAMSVALAAIAIVWGTVVLALGDRVGGAILGDTWSSARTVLPAMAVAMIGAGMASGALVGLQVLEAARALFRLRVLVGAITVAAGVGGALAAGVRGGAWGLATAYWLAGAGGWWLLHLTVRERAGNGSHRGQ
jgi:O-antigen/teichoic acid export membrane protein